MAPITDQDVAELKSLVAKLERRVAELESTTGGSSSAPKSTTERMRMVLMGPPGAGKRAHWISRKIVGNLSE